MNYKLCDGVTLEEVDGSCVLVSVTGDVAVLNETAGYIFRQIIQHKSREAIADMMISDYKAERGIIIHDIEKVMSELEDKGLVEIDTLG